MRLQQAEDIYRLYDLFLEEFILKGNSILTDDTNILTSSNLQNCFTFYVENFKDGGDSFGEKIKEQFKDADLNSRLVFAHAEYLWAFAVDDKTLWRKREYTKRTTGLEDAKLKDVYPKGFGSAGQWHNQNKYWEIKFILLIIKFIKDKVDKKEINSSLQIKEWIEKLCLYQKYEQEFEGFQIPQKLKDELPQQSLAVCNILTYVGNPDNYERIASIAHKYKILNSFSALLTEEERVNESLNIDEKLALLRKKLTELTYPGFDFYEDEFKQVWNYILTDEGYSIIQGLQYKKAVIIYGPPGTSKTYSAKRLATALITNTYLKKKENVIKYFKEEEDMILNRIHCLQLHPNYNYEDFVAGIQLRNNSTEAVKGKLFSICEAAVKDKAENPNDDMPHILILDEINRVDLSRLFGEVFSAIENREVPIEVGVGDLRLTIPRNLYIIGTMNEIDFSLERIDFALRRRFLWFFYGFDCNILSSIIRQKNDDLNTRLKNEEIERFLTNCQALNNAITKLPELGQQFQIGHTFFAEIVNIFKSYMDLKGYSKQLNKQLYRSEGPANILWSISLEPMLHAFLGNMDRESREVKISELKMIFEK